MACRDAIQPCCHFKFRPNASLHEHCHGDGDHLDQNPLHPADDTSRHLKFSHYCTHVQYLPAVTDALARHFAHTRLISPRRIAALHLNGEASKTTALAMPLHHHRPNFDSSALLRHCPTDRKLFTQEPSHIVAFSVRHAQTRSRAETTVKHQSLTIMSGDYRLPIRA